MSGRTSRPVFVVLALTVLLRLPSFAWSAISDDEGIYDATAGVLAEGGVLYVDAVDHKPPGLAFAYALLRALLPGDAAPARRLMAVHAMGAAAALGTAIGLCVLAKGLSPSTGRGWPALLFALSSTAKVPFDGLAVNGELLMGLPSIWALVAADRARRATSRQFVWLDLVAGGLLGTATLFKWQAALLGGAFLLLGPPAGRSRRALISRLAAWGAGAAVPLAAVALYFAGRGALSSAVAWGLAFNRQYLTAGPTGAFWWQRLGISLAGAALPSCLLYGAGLYQLARLVRRPSAGPLWLAVALWAAMSLWAVTLGGRFFGHYYLQAELPLCLLAGPQVARLWAQRSRAVLALLLLPALGFAALAVSPRLALGLLNRNDPDWPKAGAELVQLKQPGDTLFVWGNAPLLYHFADLPMGTRFSFCNYLTGLSPATPSERGLAPAPAPGAAGSLAWQLLREDFRERRPSLVVDTAAAGWKGYGQHPLHNYPALASWLATDYVAVGSLAGGAPVYRRR